MEYTGQAKELFIGFLIAVAVLFPLTTLYNIVSGILIGVSDGPQAVWSLVYALAIFVLIQVAIYRRFRYRLSRTIWRGIRFGLDGSTTRFVVLALGWTALTILTLGLAFPWMRVALMRYRVNNARYGTSKFAFDGSGRALIGVWLVIYALLFGGAVSAATIPAITVFFAIAALVTFAIYRVREFKYFVSATSINEVAFQSFARSAKIIWMFAITQTVFVFGVIVVAATAAGVVLLASEFPVTADFFDPELLLEAIGAEVGLWTLVGIPAFLTILLGRRAITALMLHYPLMAHICATLYIADPSGLERVVRSTEPAPRFGEGLADAFDVG